MKRLQSDFAILDVKHGRAGLRRRLKASANPTTLSEKGSGRIPVVIKGYITNAYGNGDDGESQEFEVDVSSVQVTEIGK